MKRIRRYCWWRVLPVPHSFAGKKLSMPNLNDGFPSSDNHDIEWTDARAVLFSCADVGGVDCKDDWGYVPGGHADKYAPISLTVMRADYGFSRPVGQMFMPITIDGEMFPAWGNLHVCQAYSDRLFLRTRFWRDRFLGLEIELLMVAPNACVCRFCFDNRSDGSRSLEVGTQFIAFGSSADTPPAEQDNQTHLAAVDAGWCAWRALSPLRQDVPEGAKAQMLVVISSAADKNKALDQLDNAADVDIADFRAAQQKAAHPQALEKFKPQDKTLALKVFNELRANLMVLDGRRFSAPNRLVHKGRWLWDTCFHVFAWNLFSPSMSAAFIEDLLEGQLDDGFVPINYRPDGGYTSCTQPPLIAFAADRLIQDETILRRVYPKLVAFAHWIESNRRIANGLYRWRTGGESGMDNSPRFDHVGDSNSDNNLDCTSAEVTDLVAHIDISCQMVLFWRSLARMAKRLQLPDAEKWANKADALKDTINECLYDDADGFYYDRFTDGTWRKVKTVATFWALISGVADGDRARRLVEHIMNPREFLPAMPVPSVAVDDPSFELNYWRGPVWINCSYMTVLGLLATGFTDEAKEVASRIVSGVRRQLDLTGQLWETYHPFGKSPELLEKKHAGPRENARMFAGWTATVLNMLLPDNLSQTVADLD